MYNITTQFRVLELPGFFRQDPKESNQRRLCLPKCTEDWFFKGPTCASKVHSAFLADEDELAGDEPRWWGTLPSDVQHPPHCDPDLRVEERCR